MSDRRAAAPIPTSCEPTASAGSDPYLLAWRLTGKRVVVVGGGAIGTAKIETLLNSGAKILVLDPKPSRRTQDLASQGRVRLLRRRVRPTDLVRATLVVAATGNARTNRRIRMWAKPFGAVVNAVDDIANCDVTVPAVVRRGPATIAITTGGASPAASRFLREELTDVVRKAIPEDVESMLDAAKTTRSELRHAGTYRYDYQAWRQLFFEPAMEAIRSGRLGAADEVRRRFTAEFEQAVTPVRLGQVVLVGAGPGGADLITVRGARALERADVVIYDRLADPALVDMAPVAAERIPVGKRKGSGVSQEEICNLIVDRAKAGNSVVRLKGGDPFIFGRGSEEVLAATQAGIPVSVVPGVSSALAAPALAGIPLTDRSVASSFTVLTGHLIDDNRHDWNALASSGSTLVVLMAASTADAIARSLLVGGRPGSEPVAFVHAAGRSEQQTTRRTLALVAQEGCPFPAPTVMVIGAVAADQTQVTPIHRQTWVPDQQASTQARAS